ncbi:MAG: SIMPL domain-containing protein, partial [Methylocella sp.]
AKDTFAFGARSTAILPPAERFPMPTLRFPSPHVRLVFVAALPLAIWAQLNIAHAQQFLPLIDSVPTITTNGMASTEVIPDIAIISLGVDTERPRAADAARDNARAAQAIVGEMKAQGIEAKDIKTLSVTLSPDYDETQDANGRIKRTLRGYIAHNSLSARVRETEKAGALAGQLMDKGANSFEGIAFDYTQKEAKYDALRGDAVRDALRKANSYVNGLGLKLGRVLEIATQAASPGPGGMSPKMLGAARREAAAVPIEPGSEVLRTEVQVTWELAQ